MDIMDKQIDSENDRWIDRWRGIDSTDKQADR